MLGCSHGEKTDLYAWLKGHHRNCGPQSDCSLLLGKLEAQGLNSSNTEGDNHGNGRVFSVPRPSYEAITRWGDDESRLHGAARPTSSGESEENSAARHTQEDCSFSGYYNGGDIRKDLQGESIEPTAASVKDGVDSTDAYVSDGEDSGRISPDTYRLWTTNCSKGQKNSRQSTEDCAVCHAQTTGLHTTHEQVDLIPDDTTTASCPSISSAQTVTPRRTPQHDHMPSPPKQSITLTLPQVQAALTHPLAPPIIHTVPLSQYTSAVSRRASFLDSSEPHISQLARTRTLLHDQIATLQETLDGIAAHADKIMRRRHPLRTEADMREQSEREDIYTYLKDYMCRLDAECDARHEKLHLLAREIDKLREQEGNLRVMIEAVGETVGVSVEEVNGDVGEMERLVRLIDEGEMEILSRQDHCACY
ncbi:hypothetical protein MGU_01524 [Metarhizium guizhouense ARSEF 977]|uniref:Uncharacterized protein n=1 Tax=Metarhizium guizhouense (strain ARSEF 977) TaxID=1276136 RepID=A0A0B4IBF9_METGA|nr:hypothetical protein MGU_01524 [Metarhizium guizhouense ARSEF 977]